MQNGRETGEADVSTSPFFMQVGGEHDFRIQHYCRSHGINWSWSRLFIATQYCRRQTK